MMKKMAIAAFGGFALLAGAAFAAPAPNDVGITGMGGGTYFNPDSHALPNQPSWHPAERAVGTTDEGGGTYVVPGVGG